MKNINHLNQETTRLNKMNKYNQMCQIDEVRWGNQTDNESNEIEIKI